MIEQAHESTTAVTDLPAVDSAGAVSLVHRFWAKVWQLPHNLDAIDDW